VYSVACICVLCTLSAHCSSLQSRLNCHCLRGHTKGRSLRKERHESIIDSQSDAEGPSSAGDGSFSRHRERNRVATRQGWSYRLRHWQTGEQTRIHFFRSTPAFVAENCGRGREKYKLHNILKCAF
jgi:hypothetical protein